MNSVKFKLIMVAANMVAPGIDELMYGSKIQGVVLFIFINMSMSLCLLNVFMIDSNPWTFGALMAAVHGVNAVRVMQVWRVL